MTKRLRRIRANTVYCCTQRTVDRQFLFKPEGAIREIVGASAGRAQLKMKHTYAAILTLFLTITITLSAQADCRGCCSRHGGVVCKNGITQCKNGTPISAKCEVKRCEKCGVKKKN